MSKQEQVKEVVSSEKKVTFKLSGMEERDTIIANELIFKLDELLRTYDRQVVQFKNMIEELKTQHWFLQVSKKDSPKDEERYNEIRKKKMEETQKAIESHEKAIIEAERLHESVAQFISDLSDKINMKQVENDDEIINTAEYDEAFFRPIVDLVTVLGYVDYDDVIKKKAKGVKDIQQQ